MRKQFDDLSRSGKSKFLKRIKLSNEEKSSCTNNGVEKISEENINKKNRFLDSVIPSTSKDNDNFEIILPLNDNDEGQEEEIMEETDKEIHRHAGEEIVRQDIEDIIIHEDRPLDFVAIMTVKKDCYARQRQIIAIITHRHDKEITASGIVTREGTPDA
ncbi:uncharacterized protein LOC141532644 [Cotesia typhae]|uniref:uncharacterized protein LOC141532644 n=1 Tax=Cotesia typhae TaxID=2053667 RepID=UPI003D68AD5F